MQLSYCGGSGRVLDAQEGGGLLMFWYYTQRPGICLAPVQLCGRDLSPVWFQSRTWNRFAFMVMSMSDHHCTSASGTHTWTLAKCARYSWIWCKILHSVYYNSKWILNSEIKMFIKNSNVVKCSETKRQFLYENIENSLCTQAILKHCHSINHEWKQNFFSNCPC